MLSLNVFHRQLVARSLASSVDKPFDLLCLVLDSFDARADGGLIPNVPSRKRSDGVFVGNGLHVVIELVAQWLERRWGESGKDRFNSGVHKTQTA